MAEKKLIYLADDDFSIREALKTFLEDAGYEVQVFETGDSLLKAFEKSAADLVISDVMMPGASGFMLCREIRAFSNVPVVMITSRNSELDYQIAMELGSDDFFTKPISPMNIISRVKAIFRRMDFERQKYEGRDNSTNCKVCINEQKAELQNFAQKLRKPLMSIKSYAEGSKQGIMDAKSAAGTILEATENLTTMVDDILNHFNSQKGEV